MKIRVVMVYGMLIAVYLLLQQPCRASSFFEMTLKPNSIYTPSSMNLSIKLADKATVQGKYSFRTSVHVDEKVVRKQILPATKDVPTVLIPHFPEVRGRTNVRCRAELFVNSQFIEAQEKPLVLWPPLAPALDQPKDKVIWVFDTSGALQKIFKDLQVQAADATFQAIRDFQMPDIVFIGEDVEPENLQVLINRILSKDKSPDAVVFLGQKNFPENWPVQVTSVQESPKDVSCDPNSPLLSGLSRLDMINMLSNAIPVKITKPKNKEWKIDSYIGDSAKDEKQTYSYLALIRHRKPTTIYCQLPITGLFNDDPRSALLLCNLLEFAYENGALHNK